jgi:hypothetical protein
LLVSSEIMPNDFTGRSAILNHDIERLEQEHKLLCVQMANLNGAEAILCAHESTLTELREELKRELSAKRVAVFGTAHGLQAKGDARNSELQSRLLYLVGRFDATIIMEEWASDCPPSLASTLANERVAYKNVGTPTEEQFRTFCNAPINHPSHDGTLGPCEDAPQFYEYGPLEKQENREQRMVQNIQDKMENHCVGLFIVGLAHVHSISSKLKDAGFNVAAYTWTG